MGIHDGHREKMRRRFLETGLEGFADHEALELLLYYAIPRRDTNPIAHALMERYPEAFEAEHYTIETGTNVYDYLQEA